jgi:hypothetical protein
VLYVGAELFFTPVVMVKDKSGRGSVRLVLGLSDLAYI